MSGSPFIPYCAQPVDLYPQTPHCELIIHFKRVTGGGPSKSNSADSERIEPGKSAETTPDEKPPGPLSDTKEAIKDSQGQRNDSQGTNTEVVHTTLNAVQIEDSPRRQCSTGDSKPVADALETASTSDIESDLAECRQTPEPVPDKVESEKTISTASTEGKDLDDSESTAKMVTENRDYTESVEATAKDSEGVDGTCVSRASVESASDTVGGMEVDRKTAPDGEKTQKTLTAASVKDMDSGCSEGQFTDSESVEEKALDKRAGGAKAGETEGTPRKRNDNESTAICVSPKRLRVSVEDNILKAERTPLKTTVDDVRGANTRRTPRSLRSATKTAVKTVDRGDGSDRESVEDTARKPRKISYTEVEVYAEPVEMGTDSDSQQARRSSRLRTPRKLIQIQASFRDRSRAADE